MRRIIIFGATLAVAGLAWARCRLPRRIKCQAEAGPMGDRHRGTRIRHDQRTTTW